MGCIASCRYLHSVSAWSGCNPLSMMFTMSLVGAACLALNIVIFGTKPVFVIYYTPEVGVVASTLFLSTTNVSMPSLIRRAMHFMIYLCSKLKMTSFFYRLAIENVRLPS